MCIWFGLKCRYWPDVLTLILSLISRKQGAGISDNQVPSQIFMEVEENAHGSDGRFMGVLL